MRDFSDLARKALHENGYSMSAAARAINYDLSYLSRVLSGKQSPSPQLTEALEKLLGTDGALRSAVNRDASQASPGKGSGIDGTLTEMKESTKHLLQHADTYGGDTVASAAVQVWRRAQDELDLGTIHEKDQKPYLSAVAEAAQIAGWLLFDAGRWETARSAFMESHLLARHAGDRSMQWFALDMLAMLEVESARPGGAMRIADALLSDSRLPPRVALIARVRRGRALAQMGEHRRSTTDLDAAQSGLEESQSLRDPSWAWWINSAEVSGHSGQALICVGRTKEAIPKLEFALEHATPRGVMLYRADLMCGYADAREWRRVEQELEEISLLLNVIQSGRNRRRLQEALRVLLRDHTTPSWLLGLANEVRDNAA